MIRTTLTLVFLVFSVACSVAQVDYYSNADGLAINGYDPVAYFLENKPVRGAGHLKYSWQEVEWHFKDQANLEVFKSNPEKYAPQFGGYCAYGVSEDHKSPTEPAAFTIVDNKLYLNYSLKVKQLWLKDRDNHIVKAESNWENLKENTK
jgi:YHS domain-containing protein